MASYGVQLKDKNGNKVYPSPYWPVGSIYLSVTNVNPGTIFGGTWQKIATGRVLMGASNDSQLGTTVDSGLPNITGNIRPSWSDGATSNIINDAGDGALYQSANRNMSLDYWGPYATSSEATNRYQTISFSAQRSNAIYGRSNIVQPPALYCYIWQRTA